jgi:hypothetical protein
MKYISIILVFSINIITMGCTNEFLGANKIIYKGYYVERWFLSPEYSKSNIPHGTEFYGAAANKIKSKFIIKYYINDNENSEVIIPESDMWVINHNGKRFNHQDNDNLFYYKKVGPSAYEKYQEKGAKGPLALIRNRLVAIKSCDDKGWCKVYPNYYSNDLYVKQAILKKPLSNI